LEIFVAIICLVFIIKSVVVTGLKSGENRNRDISNIIQVNCCNELKLVGYE
jgi:hypothetical protein